MGRGRETGMETLREAMRWERQPRMVQYKVPAGNPGAS